MKMKTSDLQAMKTAIKNELARRNGVGDVSEFAGSKYDLSKLPTVGEVTRPEYGEKTVDLFLKIMDYKDLQKVQKYNPIPEAFTPELTKFIEEKLSKEVTTGESEKTVKLINKDKEPEKTSCRSMCTGLCVGSCQGHCNSCHGTCSDTCGTGCASGCNSSCKGSAYILHDNICMGEAGTPEEPTEPTEPENP